MFADFIPFKPPALAAHVYFSESDMLIIKKKNWYEQIDESIFHREAIKEARKLTSVSSSSFALAKGCGAKRQLRSPFTRDSLTNFFDTKF